VKEFARKKEMSLEVDGEQVRLTGDDVDVVREEKTGFAVESDGPVTVALVTALTDELRDEGFAREVVNKIQNMRKTSGLEVTDRISVRMKPSERLKSAVEKHESFIRHETLAEDIVYVDSESADGSKVWDINGEKAAIAVEKR
jgi:isoleucyl-tRNA synthetase